LKNNRLTDISILTNTALLKILKAKQQPQKLKKENCTKTTLYDFASNEKLDEIDAREWFEMTKRQKFCDRYGKKIKNWKGALINFCKAKKQNRTQREDNA